MEDKKIQQLEAFRNLADKYIRNLGEDIKDLQKENALLQKQIRALRDVVETRQRMSYCYDWLQINLEKILQGGGSDEISTT